MLQWQNDCVPNFCVCVFFFYIITMTDILSTDMFSDIGDC